MLACNRELNNGAYSLEHGIRNEELASIDVDIDKSTWVNVQLVGVGIYDFIQTIGETMVQDRKPKIIDEISQKEVGRISRKY